MQMEVFGLIWSKSLLVWLFAVNFKVGLEEVATKTPFGNSKR